MSVLFTQLMLRIYVLSNYMEYRKIYHYCLRSTVLLMFFVSRDFKNNHGYMSFPLKGFTTYLLINKFRDPLFHWMCYEWNIYPTFLIRFSFLMEGCRERKICKKTHCHRSHFFYRSIRLILMFATLNSFEQHELRSQL